MVARLTKLFPLLLLMLILLPARPALADTGPKPTMDFQFRQEMTGEPPVTIMAGILYECDQADCSDASPLEEMGPQRFTCAVNSCRATAYGFAPYHMIAVEFSDGKTRQSNIFETAGFDSEYTVIIRPDDLLVEARFGLSGFPRTALILTACLCAFMGVGLVVGLAIFFMRRSNKS